MKRNIILMFIWLAGMLAAHATDGLTVADASIPTGKTGSIDIELTNNDNDFAGFTFNVILPDGVHFVMNGEGKPTFVKTTRFLESHNLLSGNKGTGKGAFGCYSTDAIKGKSGVILSIPVTVDDAIAVGTKLSAKITEVTFTTVEVTEKVFPDVTFDITVEENRTVLDENATAAPAASLGAVNVKVKRTIKADEWSTLCLPFAMSEAQVKAAFGDDVKLADYVDYDTTEEGGKIVGMQVNFAAATTITAHKPCLIKVSTPVSQFLVDGVNVGTKGKPANAEMKGTYKSNTEVPEYALFLSDNAFWYSKGKTTMKAFRAYFNFDDILAEVESAEAKIRFVVDEEPTAIEGIATPDVTGEVFTLQGISLGVQDVQSLPKGIYIIGGKKVNIQ